MARPLRLQFPGALYHVTSRGNARQSIFLDDTDRRLFLEFLGQEVEQQRWLCYAWCLMENHYHLLFETPDANLCRGMQRLNARYTQRFNFRHRRVGHLFQGRYKAILVQKDAYFLELCRYIALNPVRAGMTDTPEDWPWSSFSAISGHAAAPGWLASDAVLGRFGGSKREAQKHFIDFVMDGMGGASPWKKLRGQIFLGDDGFVREIQGKIDTLGPGRDIPVAQVRPLRPGKKAILEAVSSAYALSPNDVLDRKNKEAFRTAVALLRTACNLPLKEVAALAGISIGRVSQIQRVWLAGIEGATTTQKELYEKFKV